MSFAKKVLLFSVLISSMASASPGNGTFTIDLNGPLVNAQAKVNKSSESSSYKNLGNYYQVLGNDTIWSIAKKFVGEGRSFDEYQFIASIYRHNPKAFKNKDVNNLFKVRLYIPKTDEILKEDSKTGRALMRFGKMSLPPLNNQKKVIVDKKLLKETKDTNTNTLENSAPKAQTIDLKEHQKSIKNIEKQYDAVILKMKNESASMHNQISSLKDENALMHQKLQDNEKKLESLASKLESMPKDSQKNGFSNEILAILGALGAIVVLLLCLLLRKGKSCKYEANNENVKESLKEETPQPYVRDNKELTEDNTPREKSDTSLNPVLESFCATDEPLKESQGKNNQIKEKIEPTLGNISPDTKEPLIVVNNVDNSKKDSKENAVDNLNGVNSDLKEPALNKDEAIEDENDLPHEDLINASLVSANDDVAEDAAKKLYQHDEDNADFDNETVDDDPEYQKYVDKLNLAKLYIDTAEMDEAFALLDEIKNFAPQDIANEASKLLLENANQ